MCITFLWHALGSTEDVERRAFQTRYRLILAANRDEWLDRPSNKASFWEGEPGKPDILAGMDGIAGGTWLGVCQRRISWVTNYRACTDFPRLRSAVLYGSHAATAAAAVGAAAACRRRRSAAAVVVAALCMAAATLLMRRNRRRRSRGTLVREFLQGEMTAEAYAQLVAERGRAYDGFNLLVADPYGVEYVTNRMRPRAMQLPPGIYAVSNGLLDTPWGKLLRGKSLFSGVLVQQQTGELVAEGDLVSALMDVLADEESCEPPCTSWLPGVALPLLPPLPRRLERALSSVRISPTPLPFESPARLYGTRTSTVVLVNLDWTVKVVERNLDPETLRWSTQCFEFATL